ncbi:MAG: ATP synthase subunit I [Defluviitaleaceae bacterium]|nr:ATP synthase subunit I [Defluviitaleaceae bacterium]
MEYSVEAVAKRMIIVIVCASAVIALGGYIFYRSTEAIPFALGVSMAMCVNIIKVLWLKKTVTAAIDMQSKSARRHMQVQFFLRVVLTSGVFLIAGLLHGTHVNLMGVAFGIFSLTIASYSMKFLIKNPHPDTLRGKDTNSTQDAIDEISVIVEEAEKNTKDN